MLRRRGFQNRPDVVTIWMGWNDSGFWDGMPDAEHARLLAREGLAAPVAVYVDETAWFEAVEGVYRLEQILAVHHRQQLTRPAVEHHGPSARRLVAVHRRGEPPGRDLLDDHVDAQPDALAVVRGDVVVRLDPEGPLPGVREPGQPSRGLGLSRPSNAYSPPLRPWCSKPTRPMTEAASSPPG